MGQPASLGPTEHLARPRYVRYGGSRSKRIMFPELWWAELQAAAEFRLE
jgi:hypothetical protein